MYALRLCFRSELGDMTGAGGSRSSVVFGYCGETGLSLKQKKCDADSWESAAHLSGQFHGVFLEAVL